MSRIPITRRAPSVDLLHRLANWLSDMPWISSHCLTAGSESKNFCVRALALSRIAYASYQVLLRTTCTEPGSATAPGRR